VKGFLQIYIKGRQADRRTDKRAISYIWSEIRFDIIIMKLKAAYYHLYNKVRRKLSGRIKMNDLFASGHWDSLHGLGELAHYSVIRGYVNYFKPGATILDLGCGDGVQVQRFSDHEYKFYFGIDYSDVAISKAKMFENEKRKFLIADLHHFLPEGKFDVHIYNESLYYLKSPGNIVRRFSEHLNEDGIVIISMLDKKDYERPVWVDLEAILNQVDETRVINSEGVSWTVKVFSKKIPC
jgi:2-polyprenyl-3-methyl-5-hydroxy-6-metoxy-1,4-benzoquinol methylase